MKGDNSWSDLLKVTFYWEWDLLSGLDREPVRLCRTYMLARQWQEWRGTTSLSLPGEKFTLFTEHVLRFPRL